MAGRQEEVTLLPQALGSYTWQLACASDPLAHVRPCAPSAQAAAFFAEVSVDI